MLFICDQRLIRTSLPVQKWIQSGLIPKQDSIWQILRQAKHLMGFMSDGNLAAPVCSRQWSQQAHIKYPQKSNDLQLQCKPKSPPACYNAEVIVTKGTLQHSNNEGLCLKMKSDYSWDVKRMIYSRTWNLLIDDYESTVRVRCSDLDWKSRNHMLKFLHKRLLELCSRYVCLSFSTNESQLRWLTKKSCERPSLPSLLESRKERGLRYTIKNPETKICQSRCSDFRCWSGCSATCELWRWCQLPRLALHAERCLARWRQTLSQGSGSRCRA